MVLAPGNTGKVSAPCGVEAKVSIERVGPQGTPAEDRPGSSGYTLAVALTFRRTRWAAGRYSLSAGPGPRISDSLRPVVKKVIS